MTKISAENIINVVENNQRLEDSGQWVENVDRTHLVLASGKRVLQKTITYLRRLGRRIPYAWRRCIEKWTANHARSWEG